MLAEETSMFKGPFCPEFFGVYPTKLVTNMSAVGVRVRVLMYSLINCDSKELTGRLGNTTIANGHELRTDGFNSTNCFKVDFFIFVFKPNLFTTGIAMCVVFVDFTGVR